jgi:ABC-2 type transport system permease protein
MANDTSPNGTETTKESFPATVGGRPPPTWYDRSPLAQLTLARLREFLREPGTVFWVFGFPILMVVALGLAFRNGPAQLPHVAIVEPMPEWVHQSLSASEFALETLSADGVERCLAKTRCDLVVTSKSPTPASASDLVLHFDPQRPEANVAKLAVDRAFTRNRFPDAKLSFGEAPVEARGRRYVDFLLPGMIGLNLMGSSMWGIGYSIVVARKRNLLRRYAASPMRRSHFLGAYALSRLVFLVLELSALLVFGGLAFDVQVQGSVLAFIFLSLLGSISFAGISLLIGARIASIEVANGWLNFIMLPMWLLSGSFFSYERFPEVVHPILQALPLTALNDALRAVTNEAAPLYTLWPQMAVLSAWGLVCFVLSIRWFRWQ